MKNCKHDQRFHLMNATNGCCACHCEQLAKQLSLTKPLTTLLKTKLDPQAINYTHRHLEHEGWELTQTTDATQKLKQWPH